MKIRQARAKATSLNYSHSNIRARARATSLVASKEKAKEAIAWITCSAGIAMDMAITARIVLSKDQAKAAASQAKAVAKVHASLVVAHTWLRIAQKAKEREDLGVKEETKEEEAKVSGEPRANEKEKEDKCGEARGEKEAKEQEPRVTG